MRSAADWYREWVRGLDERRELLAVQLLILRRWARQWPGFAARRADDERRVAEELDRLRRAGERAAHWARRNGINLGPSSA